jgi:hypothetical protein
MERGGNDNRRATSNSYGGAADLAENARLFSDRPEPATNARMMGRS